MSQGTRSLTARKSFITKFRPPRSKTIVAGAFAGVEAKSENRPEEAKSVSVSAEDSTTAVVTTTVGAITTQVFTWRAFINNKGVSTSSVWAARTFFFPIQYFHQYTEYLVIVLLFLLLSFFFVSDPLNVLKVKSFESTNFGFFRFDIYLICFRFAIAF